MGISEEPANDGHPVVDAAAIRALLVNGGLLKLSGDGREIAGGHGGTSGGWIHTAGKRVDRPAAQPWAK